MCIEQQVSNFMLYIYELYFLPTFLLAERMHLEEQFLYKEVAIRRFAHLVSGGSPILWIYRTYERHGVAHNVFICIFCDHLFYLPNVCNACFCPLYCRVFPQQAC